MFIKSSSNELQLLILEALLISQNQPELYIQKQFYTPLFLRTLFDNMKKNIITLANSSGLLPSRLGL